MLKRVLFASFLVLLLSAPAFATPEAAPTAPEPKAEAPTPQVEPSEDGLPGLAPGLEHQPEPNYTSCRASTYCGEGETLYCSQPSGSCTDVPRNCAWGQRGYVQCGSITKYCSEPCPVSCGGQPSCQDIAAGNYPPGFCPSTCDVGGGDCGYCSAGPGGTCFCTY